MVITDGPRAIVYYAWIAFFVYWGASAFSVKEAREQATPARLFGYRVFLVSSLVLMFGALPYWPFNIQLWRAPEGLGESGAALAVIGVLVAIWARRTLAGNWSSSVTFKADHELIVRGPYRFARHPIYAGLILMMAGTVLVLGRLDSLVGFVIRAISYVFKYRQEEALMLRHFPNDYPAYMKRVRALFPLPF